MILADSSKANKIRQKKKKKKKIPGQGLQKYKGKVNIIKRTNFEK